MSEALYRNEHHIPRLSDEYSFQRMCLHIYEEVFSSPGASHYGRRGQKQGGKDIFLPDWSQGSARFPGWIWIQAKHTAAQEVPWNTVRNDLLDAAADCQLRIAPGEVYLFIVALGAPNDAKLHREYELMPERTTLPFRVEFHSWDKLCSFIVKSNRLWNLYGAPPGGILTDHMTRVFQISQKIADAYMEGQLADAREVVTELQPNFAPAYGNRRSALPADVWKQAPDLREALLVLYERAQDTLGAYDLLQYELDLTAMEDATSMLAYLRAERLAGNLRRRNDGSTNEAMFLRPGFPQVAKIVQTMSIKIQKLKGPPDVLATLALLVIMECDDREAHDGVLTMLMDVVERTSATHEELTARVAYAVVRYYYVMRHGWTGAALRYAMGDHLPGEHYSIGIRDPRLDQEFELPEFGTLRVSFLDPIASPTRSGYPSYFLLRSLVNVHAPNSSVNLPLLEEEEAIYAGGRALYNWGSIPSPTIRTLSRKRVIDMYTLAAIAWHGSYEEVFERYELYASELTFKKLLGYRSVLRSHMRRTADDGANARLLQVVELMVDRCIAGPGSGEVRAKKIYIVPVYDNLPPRPMLPFGYRNFERTPFTLAEDAAQHPLAALTKAQPLDSLRVRIDRRYENRNDEESLACLLALSLSAPLLTCKSSHASDARFMGIGSEHPGSPSRVY